MKYSQFNFGIQGFEFNQRLECVDSFPGDKGYTPQPGSVGPNTKLQGFTYKVRMYLAVVSDKILGLDWLKFVVAPLHRDVKVTADIKRVFKTSGGHGNTF